MWHAEQLGSPDPLFRASDPTQWGRKPRSRSVWEPPGARTTSGTSEQKSVETLQSSQAAGSDTDSHNVKLSFKPSTSTQRPTSHTLEISAVQRLLGRTRRQGTLSITSTETAALWARHWDRITGARTQMQPPHKIYNHSLGQKMLQNASEIHCKLHHPNPSIYNLKPWWLTYKKLTETTGGCKSRWEIQCPYLKPTPTASISL